MFDVSSVTIEGESEGPAARGQIREALSRGGLGSWGCFQAVQPGFTAQSCQLLAEWPWASCLHSKPPLFICKMKIGLKSIAQSTRKS